MCLHELFAATDITIQIIKTIVCDVDWSIAGYSLVTSGLLSGHWLVNVWTPVGYNLVTD